MSIRQIKGIIEIKDNYFYAKSPRALYELLNELRGLGYEIYNSNSAKYYNEIPPGQWYATLMNKIRMHKCNACQSYIDNTGIALIGHRCEICGALTAKASKSSYLKSTPNYQILNVYEGKEYKLHEKLPVPQFIFIFEVWDFIRLQKSEMLGEIIIQFADLEIFGNHYQKNFEDHNLKHMRTFVEHFTELDLAEWDKMISSTDNAYLIMTESIKEFCNVN